MIVLLGLLIGVALTIVWFNGLLGMGAPHWAAWGFALLTFGMMRISSQLAARK